MAKKDKVSFSEFGQWDDKLDVLGLGSDDVLDIDPQVEKPGRKPIEKVFRGAIAGAKSTAKDPGFLKEVVRKSLPEEYEYPIRVVEDAKRDIASLYDDAVTQLKPHLSTLTSNINKLIPEERKGLKKLSQKAKGFFEIPHQPRKNELSDEDRNTAAVMSSVFRTQLDTQARDKAERDIKDRVQNEQMGSLLGTTQNIDENLSRMVSYNDSVTQAYQKKSLELQYRSYYVQSQLLGVTRQYFDIFRAQNEGVALNTSLPDFVKLKKSESFRQMMRNKFMDKLREGMFGNGSYIASATQKLKTAAQRKVSSFAQSLGGASIGLGSAVMARESMASMGVDPHEMRGEMAGSLVMDAAGSMLGSKSRMKFKLGQDKKRLRELEQQRIKAERQGDPTQDLDYEIRDIKNRIVRNEGFLIELQDPNRQPGMVGKGLNYVKNLKPVKAVAQRAKPYLESAESKIKQGGFIADRNLRNLPGFVEDLYGSDFVKKADDRVYNDFDVQRNVEAATGVKGKTSAWLRGQGEKLKGFAGLGARSLLETIREPTPDLAIQTQKSGFGLTDPVTWDGRSKKALEVVLPGYLARILRETQMIRTGNENVGLTLFNYQNDSFMERGSLKEALSKSLKGKAKDSYRHSQITALVDELDSQGKLSEDARTTLRNALSDTAFSENKFTASSVMKHVESQGVSDGLKQELDQHLKNRFDTEERSHHLSKSLLNIKQLTPDLRSNIQQMYDLGYGSILEELGILEKTSNGGIKISDKKYKEFLRDGGVSDSPKPPTPVSTPVSSILPMGDRRKLTPVPPADLFPTDGNLAIKPEAERESSPKRSHRQRKTNEGLITRRRRRAMKDLQNLMPTAETVKTVQDIFSPGNLSPVLEAKKLEAQQYYDQISGRVIQSVKDIKGPVVDETGKLVVTMGDIQKGLVTSTGQKLKPTLGTFWQGIKKAQGLDRKIMGGLWQGGKIGAGMLLGGVKAAGGLAAEAVRPEGFLDKTMGAVKSAKGGLWSALSGLGGGFAGKLFKSKTEDRKEGEEHPKETRKGDWHGMLDNLQKKKEEALKNRHVATASLDPRYKSSKNVFDAMIEKAQSSMGTIMDGMQSLGGLFKRKSKGGLADKLSEVADVADAIPETGAKRKVPLIKRVLRPVLRGAGGLIKNTVKAPFAAGGMAANAARTVGTPLVNMMEGAATAVASHPVGANILSKLGVARNIAMVADLGLFGGAGTAIMGTLGSLLASPVVIGGAAIAGAGYGAYKAYKYFTRNKVTPLDVIRMRQYGLTEQNKDYYHKVLELEGYLTENGVGYREGQPYLIAGKIKVPEILQIFSIDPKDEKHLKAFITWFNQRFKPVFLNHLKVLFGINPKLSIQEVDKLSDDLKLQYINASAWEAGPYDITASPLTEFDRLQGGKDDVLTAVNIAKSGIKPPKKDQTDKAKEASIFASLGQKVKNTWDGVTEIVSSAWDGAKKAVSDVWGGVKSLFGFKDSAPTNPAQTGTIPGIAPKGFVSNGAEGEGQSPLGQDTNAPNAKFSFPKAKIPAESGPLSDGSGADQYLKIGSNVDISGVNPAMWQNFRAMVQEYGEKTGKSVSITSAFRSFQKQQALYNAAKDKSMVAKPGRSLHEFGLALDVDYKDGTSLNEMDKMGLMRKYGFTRPVGSEPWHTEPAGIQVNIGRARDDQGFATQAVMASLGRGGGGLGTMGKGPKGRDFDLAMKLLGGDFSQSVPNTPTKPLEGMSPIVSKASAPTAPTMGGGGGGFSNPTAAPQVSIGGEGETSSVMSKASPGMMGGTASWGASTGAGGGMGGLVSAAISGKGYGSSVAALKDRPEPAKPPLGPMKPGVQGIASMLDNVGNKTGVNSGILKAMAAIESGFNPQASGGSAKGLFQFMPSTWASMLRTKGQKYGLPPNASPLDPQANALMGAEYMKDNIVKLRSVKPDINATDVYMAHFLGSAGGPKFLRGLATKPNAIAANDFPSEAHSNPGIFNQGSYSQIYNFLSNRLSTRAQQFGVDIGSAATAAMGAITPNLPATDYSAQIGSGLFGGGTSGGVAPPPPPRHHTEAYTGSGRLIDDGSSPPIPKVASSLVAASPPSLGTPVTTAPVVPPPAPTRSIEKPVTTAPKLDLPGLGPTPTPVDTGGHVYDLKGTLDSSLSIQKESRDIQKGMWDTLNEILKVLNQRHGGGESPKPPSEPSTPVPHPKDMRRRVESLPKPAYDIKRQTSS